MPGIETLHGYDGSLTATVMFRWRDMIISLVETSLPDGKKCLTVLPEGASPAGLSQDGTMATWIISPEDAEHKDVHVSINSNGSVPNVTGPNT